MCAYAYDAYPVPELGHRISTMLMIICGCMQNWRRGTRVRRVSVVVASCSIVAAYCQFLIQIKVCLRLWSHSPTMVHLYPGKMFREQGTEGTETRVCISIPWYPSTRVCKREYLSTTSPVSKKIDKFET